MKKFEFRLASVLRLRELQLSTEKGKLHELLVERDRLAQTLASIEAEQKESLEWVRNREDANSADLRALSAFLVSSKARQTSARQAVESCATDIHDQRSRVMAAECNQKLLLKLKEKRLSAWQYAADRELETIAQEAWQSAARKAD